MTIEKDQMRRRLGSPSHRGIWHVLLLLVLCFLVLISFPAYSNASSAPQVEININGPQAGEEQLQNFFQNFYNFEAKFTDGLQFPLM